MAYDEELAARVRRRLSSFTGISEKKRFGGLCFLLQGNMCCGVLRDELVVRQAPERVEDLLRGPHTRPMDFTGRPLRGFLFVAPEGLRTDAALRRWISLGVSFAKSLPRKPGRGKRPKRARKRPGS